MGICQSQEEKTMVQKSKAIDKEMMQGHIAQQKVVKLLLLGITIKFYKRIMLSSLIQYILLQNTMC